jgi:hypothetical protein
MSGDKPFKRPFQLSHLYKDIGAQTAANRARAREEFVERHAQTMAAHRAEWDRQHPPDSPGPKVTWGSPKTRAKLAAERKRINEDNAAEERQYEDEDAANQQEDEALEMAALSAQRQQGPQPAAFTPIRLMNTPPSWDDVPETVSPAAVRRRARPPSPPQRFRSQAPMREAAPPASSSSSLSLGSSSSSSSSSSSISFESMRSPSPPARRAKPPPPPPPRNKRFLDD